MNGPFRWDLARQEQLGRLIEGPMAESYAAFLDDLRDCCARVVAFCGNADLVFIGRSPESIFDYLSGLLSDTSWADRCTLFLFSMRCALRGDTAPSPSALGAIRDQFRSADIGPEQLLRRPRPVAFVDIVYTGETLGNFVGLLLAWTREIRADEAAVKGKMRFVGITMREKTSPKTWRWQQHVAWARAFPSAIMNVSVPFRLYRYLGDDQEKVTPSNTPGRWGEESLRRPPRDPRHLKALRLAYHLYCLGRTPEHRRAFAGRLTDQPAMRESWFRNLVQEMKRGS
jgi:hypothetical protein